MHTHGTPKHGTTILLVALITTVLCLADRSVAKGPSAAATTSAADRPSAAPPTSAAAGPSTPDPPSPGPTSPAPDRPLQLG